MGSVVHERGRCAMYGSGGSVSFFGPKLPAPNNVAAKKLSAQQYDMLTGICGDSWRDVDYACCDDDQMEALRSNLLKAEPLIASCPACKENFYQLFCHFSCSPDQSTFVNVIKTQLDMDGKEVVDTVQFYIDSARFAEPFFDSCKNIKFGATNGYAMDLIGGGASNYSQFLSFLGEKKPELGGSPFEIDFLYSNDNKSIDLFQVSPKSCNDKDPQFRCACSDCPEMCPNLDALPNNGGNCTIGPLSCASFYIAITYLLIFLLYFVLGFYKRYLANRKSTFNDGFLVDDPDEFFENDEDSQEINYEDLSAGPSQHSYPLNDKLESWFYNLGYFCATHTKLVIFTTLAISGTLSSFIYFLELETNPVNLWVSSSADAYIQKQKFDESFGPFYRTQQIIISNSTGPVLQSYDFIEWWFEKEREILNLSVDADFNNITYQVGYNDICFKPLDDTCIIESFTQYFDGDINKLSRENWKEQLKRCTDSPVDCLPSFQQPLKRSLIFGGDSNSPVLDSDAIVVTLLNNNDNEPDSQQIQFASKWESTLENYLLINLTNEASALGLNIGFTTEISLEKELNKSTNTDVKIVIISYMVMFAYASLALGFSIQNSNTHIKFNSVFGPINRFTGILKMLRNTRFGLGLIGIIIVLISVTSSVGFWAFCGLKSTLIIAEVIPFLILAVGVDNIFLICNSVSLIEESEGITRDLSIPAKIGYALSSVGSSILLSCACQFICFMLGSLVGMPAVRNFALYSAVAILFNTLLQLTVFLCFLSYDLSRLESGKLDLLAFIEVQTEVTSNEASHLDYNIMNDLLIEGEREDGLITRFFRNWYVHRLFSSSTSRFILWATIVFTGIALSIIPNIELGLDQRIALPSDSYLIDYFNDIYQYLNVGPPTYFVTETFDVTNHKNQQSLCSKFTSCDSFSLVNILLQEAERANQSFIAEPPASWIDDFLMWLNPSLSDCCTIKRHPLDSSKEFCPPFSSPRICQTCFEDRTWDFDMSGFPVGDEFLEFMLAWLDQGSSPCPLGGKAPYGHSIDFETEDYKDGQLVKGVKRSAFRSSHIPLRSQEDFIKAYENSLRITREIESKHKGLNVWAYSPFYIFFVQYETIIKLTLTLLGVGLVSIFFVSTVLLGSWKNSLILIIYLAIVLTFIGSWMAIQGIGLNAISLVNLLICLGLSVEFGIHLVREFNFTSAISNRVQLNVDEESNNEIDLTKLQAKDSLISVGPSTLSGITLTKIIGIFVLSFTRSQIFRVYYFKMWVGLIASASVCSLVVLPILLGKFGDKGWETRKL